MPGIQLERKVVPLNSLLLDPNNPRFLDLKDWKRVEPNLYHLETQQNIAFQRLEGTDASQIEDLRKSIIANGFVNAETIVAKPYEFEPDKYVVIEGNRRLTAIRGIVRECVNPQSDPLVQSLQNMEVLIYTPVGDEEQDRANEMVLQGIRHIGGPKKWGAYQQADLIVQLHDNLKQNFTTIGNRLALGPIITARYYRAYKVLRQMMEDEEFSQYTSPDMFSLFEEAIKNTSIRDWLGWNEQQMCFTEQQHLRQFYNMLVDDADDSKPRILKNPQAMRQLGRLIEYPRYLQRVADRELSIDDAARLANPDTVTVPFGETLRAFLVDLSRFPAMQVTNLTSDDISKFDQIADELNKLRKLHAAMTM